MSADVDLERLKATLDEVGEKMSREEPWNELLWGPIESLGLDSVLLDSMVVRLTAKTMPGKSLTVERELRWRAKRALDAAGIRVVGGTTVIPEEDPDAGPTAAVAAPRRTRTPTPPGGGGVPDRTGTAGPVGRTSHPAACTREAAFPNRGRRLSRCPVIAP